MGQSNTLPQPGDLTSDGGIVVSHYGELFQVTEGVAWVTPAQAEGAIAADTPLTRIYGGWHRTRNVSDSEHAVQIELGRNTTNNLMRRLPARLKSGVGREPDPEPPAPELHASGAGPSPALNQETEHE